MTISSAKSLRWRREKIVAQINALYKLNNHRRLEDDERQKLTILEDELERMAE